MRTAAIAFVLALAGIASSPPAAAHGRVHSHVSVGVGFGYWGPYWGPPWWYYPPAPVYYPVVVPAQPVTYIEQGSNQAAPASNDGGGWWYYCDASKGYYPYVKECPGGWQRVSPTPPPSK